MSKDRITPSEILLVINGGPPTNIDPEASKRGIREHKRIISEVKMGIIPLTLRQAGLELPVVSETPFETDIIDNMVLRARADLATDFMTIDLKPGRQIKGRYLLQAALTAIAHDVKGSAEVYLYDLGETYKIEDGGENAREEMEIIARNARIILNNEEEIKLKKRSLGGEGLYILGRQSIKLRKELEKNTEIVMDKIKKNLSVYKN